jgi:hypothetical protein
MKAAVTQPVSPKAAQVLAILEGMPPLTPARAKKIAAAIKSFSGREFAVLAEASKARYRRRAKSVSAKAKQ